MVRKSKSVEYNENDIQVLSEIEHVHKRSQVYLGSTAQTMYDVPLFGETFNIEPLSFVPAVMKLFSEVVDNANDELVKFRPRNPFIKITANPETGEFSVEDNGRGVPIGMHETGRHTPEVVFSTLRSGRNFDDDGKEAGVIGTNGMGVSLSAICSEEFIIEIHRDDKLYTQTLRDATRNIEPPTIVSKKTRKTGTKITLKLKQDIFESITLPYGLVRNRAIELAATNPGLTIHFNDEIFLYKKGFSDLLDKYFPSYQTFASDELKFFVVFDQHNNPEETMFSWVNSSLLYDGGICNTQFVNAFVGKVEAHLEKEAKKKKITVNRNDIRHGLMIFGALTVANPQYDSQAKTKLTGPNLRKDMDVILDAEWAKFVRANKEWLESIMERALARSNQQATKQLIKQKTAKVQVDGFMEATSRNRSDCQLLLTEGNSAKANIVQSRDPKTTAAMPMRGKINNVYGSSVVELMKMKMVTDLLNTIGLVPGKRAMRSELRYGRVCFATDADYDGDHITTLLVCLFYEYWPELFDPRYPPFFYRMIAPNMVAQKGKKRVHFPNREAFDQVKGKYKTWEISYLKGLGTMIKRDWDMILKGETDVFRPIQDDGNMPDVMKLLFGPDPDVRKDWLQTAQDVGTIEE